jgi:hypothetical protein
MLNPAVVPTSGRAALSLSLAVLALYALVIIVGAIRLFAKASTK